MHYPPIKSGIRYEVWRWREDVAKWVKVTDLPTIEMARTRREKETATRSELSVLRVTETTITRKEVS